MPHVVPKLIHPTPVEIQQINRVATKMDPEAREPVQQAVRATTVIVNGQPKWVSQLQKGHDKGGSTETSIGYVLFRLIDLDALGISLQQNDRFKKIGRIVTDVFIMRLEYTGHYDEGPTLVKAHFRDRQPGKQNRGS